MNQIIRYIIKFNKSYRGVKGKAWEPFAITKRQMKRRAIALK